MKNDNELASHSDDDRKPPQIHVKAWRFPTLKKVSGLVGVIVCVLLLVLIGMSLITWRLFWIILIIIAGFAYFLLPRMED